MKLKATPCRFLSVPRFQAPVVDCAPALKTKLRFDEPVSVKNNIPVFSRGLFSTYGVKCGETILTEKPFIRLSKYSSRLREKYKLGGLRSDCRRIAAVLMEVFSWAKRIGNSDPLATSEFQMLKSSRVVSLEERELIRDEIYPYLKHNLLQLGSQEFFTADYLLSVYERTATNAYGSGLYQQISFINHSCYPNACFKPIHTRRGLRSSNQTLVAICDILPGEQIFLSYTDYDGFPLEFLEDLNIKCNNKPGDLNEILRCSCCSGRSRESIKKLLALHDGTC